MRWLDSITESMHMNFSKLQETVEDRGAWCGPSMGLQRIRHNLATEHQVLGLTGHNISVGTIRNYCLSEKVETTCRNGCGLCANKILQEQAEGQIWPHRP